ncbi:MAG: type I restriction endonuclease [Candidatus Cybelea sp.]
MSDILKEKTYEAELVRELCARGWIEGKDREYDRELALYPEDVIAWLEDSQPNEFAKISDVKNGDGTRLLLERLTKTIQENGSIAVLRNGFKRINARFDMCAFMPNQKMNPEALERHAKVRCRVVRQVHYSTANGNSIDVVLFVNGIPVATLELKTEFTQTVQDAINQYKLDRRPKDATGHVEPLLTPRRGAVVHFAVSTDEVHMTTELAGSKTVFLPFNLGDDGAAGNPPNPSGFMTSYLWERILMRDAWLEILDRFVHTEKPDPKSGKEQLERVIFPRYHQWDAVTKLVGAAKAEGSGHNYLVQHSAGSGKSNSIMWLAHRLSNLHDSKDDKIFDSVIVVTDRTVLDDQLQRVISQYEHKTGVVKRIGNEGAKSTQLRDALANRTPIIIVTIQTFPPALAYISEMPSLSDRTFAIIADEAHSSQTGEAAKKVRELLGVSDDETRDEDEAVSIEDVLLAQMAKRAQSKNISYFAFTATPKPKTLDVFGRLDAAGHKVPFHEYTMEQAIEEGFILDVLQNYTTYEFAYRLATRDEKSGGDLVPKSEAAKLIARWMKLHPANVAQKVELIVEHFRETVRPLLSGKAKAMVVCDSRKMAVKYKLAIDTYVKSRKYDDVHTLVAFSGEVADATEWPGSTFTENGMNELKRESIPEAFGRDDYQVLIVAEKFQTGFDQPLLVAMYVDKKLAGINAVQTLSRLNRTYDQRGVKKSATYVLDFQNRADDILDAFKPYYKAAYLTEAANPDLIHDLQAKLDGYGIYGTNDVEAYVTAYIQATLAKKGDERQSTVKAILDPVARRYRDRVGEAKSSKNDTELELARIFRHNLSAFVRLYGFLSQIYNYGDTELEKRALFYGGLVRLIHDERDETPIDLSGVVPTHLRKRMTFTGTIDLKGSVDGSGLAPAKDVGTAKARAKAYGPLAEVIAVLNELMGLSEDDEYAIRWLDVYKKKVEDKDSLRDQATHNTFEQFVDAGDVVQACKDALLETQEDRIAKNEEENQVVQKITERFFADKDALDKLVTATSKYAYDLFNQGPQT